MDSLVDVQAFWFWLGLTFALLAVEALIAPTGFFLGMGTAAAAVALVTFIFPDLSWLWALTLFAMLTVVAGWVWWVMVRSRSARNSEAPELNLKARQLLGYRGVLDQALRNGKGKLRVNDSPWMVEADQDYPAGTRVEVVRVRGIVLEVKSLPEVDKNAGAE
jgi:membrane protein implicated in regulation of membrane protease activity